MTNNDKGKSMKGIRPKGICAKCKGKFRPHESLGYACPDCLTTPRRFQIDFSHKGRIRRERDLSGNPLSTFAQARLLLQGAKRQIEAGIFDRSEWVSSGGGEFRAEVLMSQWLNEAAISNGYREQLASVTKNHFIPVFKGMDVRGIRKTHIKELLRRKTAPSTQVTHLQMLRGFFRWLKEDKGVIQNVPQFPKVKKVPEKTVRLIDRETQLVLLGLMPKQHQPIFTFLFYQVCRPAEVRALQRDCLSQEHVTYRREYSGRRLVQYKETRVNYLFSRVRAAIPKMTSSSFVFTHRRYGKDIPYSHTMLERIYKDALIKLNQLRASEGLAPLAIGLYQATKHSGGAHLYNKEGIAIDILRQWMGHSGLSTTERYARLDGKDKRKGGELE